MQIIQKPESISLLGNMKHFVVSSDTDVVFVLKLGETTLFEATYQAASNIEIDITEILEVNLSFTLDFNLSFYEQKNICRTFTALINDASVSFLVLRAGVAFLQDTTENFLQSNFLTWQPSEKEVTLYSPEWLTFFSTKRAYLVLEVHSIFDRSRKITISECEPKKVYTANVIASYIAMLAGFQPVSYELWLEDVGGVAVSDKQKFLLRDCRSEQEEYFLFENTLGGIDSFSAIGDSEYEYKTAITNARMQTVGVNVIDEFQKNTGYLDAYEREWLQDFFRSKRKYKFHAFGIKPIVITECNAQFSTSDLPSNYSFTYQLSERTQYLNTKKHGK